MKHDIGSFVFHVVTLNIAAALFMFALGGAYWKLLCFAAGMGLVVWTHR